MPWLYLPFGTQVAYALVDADTFISRFKVQIIQPTIMFLFAVALLVFIWGLVQFLGNPESEEGRAGGKRHMIYGLIGLLIMSSALGILRLTVNTFDLKAPGEVNSLLPR